MTLHLSPPKFSFTSEPIGPRWKKFYLSLDRVTSSVLHRVLLFVVRWTSFNCGKPEIFGRMSGNIGKLAVSTRKEEEMYPSRASRLFLGMIFANITGFLVKTITHSNFWKIYFHLNLGIPTVDLRLVLFDHHNIVTHNNIIISYL